MTIDLLFITYNRLDYTKVALASVLADRNEEFSLTIWDNASSDGTVKFLKEEVRDPRIARVVFSEQNVGQAAALNAVWGQSRADLVGKVDNDCIVTPGWTKVLAQAHRDIERLGVVACWHFFPDDFDYEKAKRKIHQFGHHQILRHPWTCGTGLLVKRVSYERYGPFRRKATTDLWLKLARAGYINGFYYPLIYQEHMDDPRSQYSRLRCLPFEEAYKHSYVWQAGTVADEDGIHSLQKRILGNLLTGSFDPSDYVDPMWKRLWRWVGGAGRRSLSEHSMKRVT